VGYQRHTPPRRSVKCTTEGEHFVCFHVFLEINKRLWAQLCAVAGPCPASWPPLPHFPPHQMVSNDGY
jgi:hypothetical protein